MRSVESEISGLPYELARRFVESCSSRVEFGANDGATSASEVDQPSSRSVAYARRTVWRLTSIDSARARADGRRSPGPISPRMTEPRTPPAAICSASGVVEA